MKRRRRERRRSRMRMRTTIGMGTLERTPKKKEKKGTEVGAEEATRADRRRTSLQRRGPIFNPGDRIYRRGILRSSQRGMVPTSALEPRRRRRRSWRRRRRRDEDLPVLQQTGIFNVKAERVETKINEVRAMELEAQVFKAQRDRERQSCR